jgi:hypothetical protein
VTPRIITLEWGPKRQRCGIAGTSVDFEWAQASADAFWMSAICHDAWAMEHAKGCCWIGRSGWRRPQRVEAARPVMDW